MIRRCRLVVCFAVSLWAVATHPTTAAAVEIGFVEDFALATNRDEALKLLIPGSEDYFYYTALHLQNTEQYDRVEEVIRAWVKQHGETERVQAMQVRQALLTYDRHPAESLELLRRRLGIEFHHQREAASGEKPQFPTRLDPALLEREKLTANALAAHADLSGFEDAALDWLTQRDLHPDQRRHLLHRLAQPDQPRLVELILLDLDHRPTIAFGAHPIHQRLLLSQLDELVRQRPALLEQQRFIDAYLARLQPADDVDWRHDPIEQDALLTRLWTFVARLAPVQNSLKAHVLYHRLAFDRARGVYDQDRFLEYLRLPRRAGYVRPEFLSQPAHAAYAADLAADYRSHTQFPPIGSDEPLVRGYFQHFFATENDLQPYAPYVQDDYLRQVLAETKILLGLGDVEQWYSWLPPDFLRALQDRVELDFVPTNQDRFGRDEPVTLELDVKNINSLIVRVFEINARNYYRQQGRPVNTDINLDGLVANEERTFEFKEPPLRRVRRRFDFPALNRPGVFVVDFIGNGMSSRAVVHKGQLRHVEHSTAAGHLFTVLDESNQVVRDAVIWMAGQEYRPDEAGRVFLPFSTQPGNQPIVLERGEQASLAYFNHAAENYQLRAGFHVEREALLAGRTATVVVRPGLTINGQPASVALLEDVRLTITSTNADGVAATKTIADLKLHDDDESIHEFLVPPRLASVAFQLQGRLRAISQQQTIDVEAHDSLTLNAIDQTARIEWPHLVRLEQGYAIDLLGKTGEPLADRPVTLTLKHRDFTAPIHAQVQTDEQGRIALGPLAEIVAVTTATAAGSEQSWRLSGDEFTYPRSLHGRVGDVLALPHLADAAAPLRDVYSLLELRGSAPYTDRLADLRVENGLLQIAGLTPGNYELRIKPRNEAIQLSVTDGPVVAGYAMGAVRQLELRPASFAAIAKASPLADVLEIQVLHATEAARVHVFATRYQPAFPAFGKLASVGTAEPYRVPRVPPLTLYAAGRNIGDEYRYILDRRYAAKYPGIMLDRPSLLLNPWELRDTQTDLEEAAKGGAFDPAAMPAAPAAEAAAAAERSVAAGGEIANLDFLADAAPVALNLVPDEAGIVRVPRTTFGDRHDVHVVLVASTGTMYKRVTLPEPNVLYRDLRLAKSLDVNRHFTQQKQMRVLPAGEPLVVNDISAARFELYDSLTRVYGLFRTLNDDPHLAEFSFVLQWPKLSPEDKRTQYSKYACHELNFFLYQKDRPFFESVVRPFLVNKKDQTFLDAWLLERDVESFLRPWQYQRLNTIERILLAQRIERDRTHARQDIEDRWAVLPKDQDRLQWLFQTALAGRAMETRAGVALADKDALFFRDSMTTDLAAAAPPPAPASVGFGGGGGGLGEARPPERLGRRNLNEAEGKAEEALKKAASGDLAFGKELRLAVELKRKATLQLYRSPDQTKEWVENNYYKLPIEQHLADRVLVNGFWKDYAGHVAGQPFLSPQFAEATSNFTEIMFALAVLDLPFEADEPEAKVDNLTLTLKAAGDAIVVQEEIRAATAAAERSSILVSQNFFRADDRYRFEGEERFDKFVADEFLKQVVYGCQVVVTNPTSARQKLDALLQIPAGSLPVQGTQATRGAPIDLQPYGTTTLEYFFYFPATGEFSVYPVQISQRDQLLVAAAAATLRVVEQPSRVDRASWEFVSQHGAAQEVLQFLQQANLHRLDLDKIAFRLPDRDFFQRTIRLLTDRHVYAPTLWSYGLKHNEPAAVREFLAHADLITSQAGPYLHCSLLVIDPVERHAYQQIDYRPLVNPRAHPLGRRRQILNERLHQQYTSLLHILACRRELTNDDLLAVTYYLLLQDRIDEAIGFFQRVDARQLETRLQYDAFAAYLHLYREDIDAARAIARSYASYPVDRWRNHFAALDRQLDEISSGTAIVVDADSREQQQSLLASQEPSLELAVEGQTIKLTHRNLAQVVVNYYLMDVELLFSRNPFVQQFSGQFSHIRPNLSQPLDLPANQSATELAMAAPMQLKNVLIEVVGGGKSASQAVYANAMRVQLSENHGQLSVGDQHGMPLPRTYVKVYARLADGSVQFFKDGYTDLRGRFDYASLNTDELTRAERLSILILSEAHGATIRETAPPKQ